MQSSLSNGHPPFLHPNLAELRPPPLFSNPPFMEKSNGDAPSKISADMVRRDGENGPSGNSIAGASATSVVGGSSAFRDPHQANLEIRRSVCQSPSWEAYARRKQEKKDTKKELEQTSKQTKPKTRRLSKAPPPAQQPQHNRTQSESNLPKPAEPRSKSRGRTSSVLAFAGLGKGENTVPKPRSRSGSLSSLFRNTFELRRPSVDLAGDPGFIGGVKLERRRTESSETELRAQGDKEENPSVPDIHPAFRDNASRGRPTKNGPASQLPQLSLRGHYPPIAMQTSPSATTQALAAPARPSSSDRSTMRKWRARVGLKTSQSDQQKTDQTSKQRPEKTGDTSGPTITNIPTARVSSPALLGSKLVQSPSTEAGHAAPRSTPVFINNFGTSYSPPPPAPPRKSSKRKSVGSMESPTDIPALLSRTDFGQEISNPDSNPVATHSASSSGAEDGTTPTIDDLDVQMRTLKEAARAAFSRHSTGPKAPATRSRYADLSARPQTSSSDDSVSEDYRSVTSATTPDTSRPQSEKGLFLTSPSIGQGNDKRKALGQSEESSARPSISPNREEIDPIQAAADKVRAAFPDPPIQPKNLSYRPKSDRTSSQDVNQPRRVAARPADGDEPRPYSSYAQPSWTGDDVLPIHDIIMLNDESSVAAPWPATYLEAARKAAPAALPPRSVKEAPAPSSADYTPDRASSLSPRGKTFPSDGRAQAEQASLAETSSGKDLDLARRDTVAKLFVECCHCLYYHDLPSKLYEAMANPRGIWGPGDAMDYAGAISMTVKCPWCQHEMSTKCCAGLAAMVHIKERLH